MEPLVLHSDAFWISPYVFSCFVVLREKGLPFEVREVALQRREQASPEYRARSLTGRVPRLDHGSFSLAESSAIIEYLDEAFPATPPALPKDPQERARARMVMAWVRSDLMPIREERATHTMFYQRTDKPLSPKGEEAAASLLRVADALIPDGKTQLFGAWSAADNDLAFMLQRLIQNGHEVPAKVRAFAEAQWRRPSVQEYVAHPRMPYVAY